MTFDSFFLCLVTPPIPSNVLFSQKIWFIFMDFFVVCFCFFLVGFLFYWWNFLCRVNFFMLERKIGFLQKKKVKRTFDFHGNLFFFRCPSKKENGRKYKKRSRKFCIIMEPFNLVFGCCCCYCCYGQWWIFPCVSFKLGNLFICTPLILLLPEYCVNCYFILIPYINFSCISSSLNVIKTMTIC